MSPKYPWPTQAQQIETLHIYRHLLREISYLPPAFSSTISSTVRNRFHSNRKPNPHDKKRIADARRGLRNIRLANHGDGPRMLKLMHKGFGRTGPRRWQLFEKLRSPEGVEDSDALEALTGDQLAQIEKSEDSMSQKEKDRQRRKEMVWPGQKIPSDSEKAARAARKADIKAKAEPTAHNANLSHRWLESWDRPKLTAFLKSQQEQQGHMGKGGVRWDHVDIRHTHETQFVPEETTWGKLPTQSLVRTKVAKYWIMQSAKILPPLGKGEWELLKKLSSGAQAKGEWQIPKRRTPARPLHKDYDEAESEDWDWERHASQKTRGFEPSTLVKSSKQLGHPTAPFTGPAPRNALPERWFRRQYQSIFLKSAYAEKNPNTLKDHYVWGKQRAYKARPAPHQMRLFEAPEKIRPPLVYLFKQAHASPLHSRFS